MFYIMCFFIYWIYLWVYVGGMEEVCGFLVFLFMFRNFIICEGLFFYFKYFKSFELVFVNFEEGY